MIDPKLLTAENGFVDGVVVEIVLAGGSKDLSYFEHADSDEAGFCDSFGSWIMTKENLHVSIRPLTGPMSIWNFAPEWADYCWHEESSLIWYKGPIMIGSTGRVSIRPFWAKDTP